jgi:hypothetical protein
MISALKEINPDSVYSIHETVFAGDSPRRSVGIKVLEPFVLSNAFKRRSLNLFGEF